MIADRKLGTQRRARMVTKRKDLSIYDLASFFSRRKRSGMRSVGKRKRQGSALVRQAKKFGQRIKKAIL